MAALFPLAPLLIGVAVKEHQTGFPAYHLFPWQHPLVGWKVQRGVLETVWVHDGTDISLFLAAYFK